MNTKIDTEIIKHNKFLARKCSRSIRNSIPEQTRYSQSEQIASALNEISEFKNCELLLSYIPMKDEASTWPTIELAHKMGIRIAAPRTYWKSKSMEWFELDNFADLEVSPLGILEPPENEFRKLHLPINSLRATALVPGLMFDRQGYRLGYGGGFYDRFLKNFQGSTIGIGFENQLYPCLKEMGLIEAHDTKLDYVVTECEVIRTPSAEPEP